MFGDSFLVVLVFLEDGYVEYYVLEGVWINILIGEKIEGGRWRKEKYGYFSFLFLVRLNIIILMGSVDIKFDYDYVDNVVFNVYYIDSGKIVKFQVRNIEGKVEVEIEVIRDKDIIYVIKIKDMKKLWSLYFDFLKIEVLLGVSVEVKEKGSRVIISDDIVVLKVI